jgi:hypothetical protein
MHTHTNLKTVQELLAPASVVPETMKTLEHNGTTLEPETIIAQLHCSAMMSTAHATFSARNTYKNTFNLHTPT